MRRRYINLILSTIVFLSSISTAFGLRQASTDSLMARWHLVETGKLKIPDSLKARLLLDIGISISYNTPDSAFSYYDKALELSQNFRSLTGDILNRKGYTNYILGNYDLALIYWRFISL